MARRAWGAGGVVALVLALVGCAGGGGADAAAERVVAGAAARLERDTVTIRTVSRTVGDGRPVVVRSVAVVDFRRHDERLTLGGSGGVPHSEIRVVDGVSYLRSPTVPTAIAAGPGVAAGPAQPTKPWFRVDDAELADLGAELRPQHLVARLRVAARIEADGSDRVDGVATTRYRLSAEGGRHQPDAVTAWIDRAGRLRRLVARGHQDGARFTTVTRLSGFGAPIAVSAPPPEQVFDLTAPRIPNLA